jgi:hypothetical protein
MVLLAIIRSGRECWLPVEEQSGGLASKLTHLLVEYRFWSEECPGLQRQIEVLRELANNVGLEV